ncbi:hypothetical protein K437DRAFT_256356 [Tilletiaria anomala UBC 951]|uniref:Uncharacterized protein n=1 Tax=Tilletiaria anomala (strain ATCC 24038 / CBS 436.72 / UBC 951) TaxID=1037660 RepID=A0A066VWU5_TILAU|nr:uncharacterized protein K437DRAFT_256356 [Tilletiaria anomala UBC 951]KDN45941.1 hypothetical protein K437DRAFT_256356 [Tilletiaria anomala UBC 951]
MEDGDGVALAVLEVEEAEDCVLPGKEAAAPLLARESGVAEVNMPDDEAGKATDMVFWLRQTYAHNRKCARWSQSRRGARRYKRKADKTIESRWRCDWSKGVVRGSDPVEVVEAEWKVILGQHPVSLFCFSLNLGCTCWRRRQDGADGFTQS